MQKADDETWTGALRVMRPALLGASTTMVDNVTAGLADAGIQAAVARHDSAPIYNWMARQIPLQGIADAVAFGFDARHGGITWAAVDRALRARPSCPRLRCYWSLAGCGWRRGTGRCAEPAHVAACPLPRHPLRKGALNVAAFSLALFIRDVCGGDFVGWLDARLAGADPGCGVPGRAAAMRNAVLQPLTQIYGIGPKLWSMTMAELLLAGDPARERWVATGASMIAVDSLVHNFLHRTGTLRRLGAEHPYGPACYAPDGCAAVIEALAERVDAREFNSRYPATFPRFVQHAIWRWCTAGDLDLCNGHRIDDRARCQQALNCAAYAACDRVSLHGS